MVQRTQFSFVVTEMSKTCVEMRSVGKDKVHREMDLFRDVQENTAMDNLQSAGTNDFLAVRFPRKNISPSDLWPESLRLPSRGGLKSSHI